MNKVLKFFKSEFPHKLVTHLYEDEECMSLSIMIDDGSGFVRVYRNKLETVATISDLSVDEDSRKKGLGTELITFAENAAKVVMDADWIQLRVLCGSWMEKWYERLGYIKIYLDEDNKYKWLIKQVKNE